MLLATVSDIKKSMSYFGAKGPFAAASEMIFSAQRQIYFDNLKSFYSTGIFFKFYQFYSTLGFSDTSFLSMK